VIRGRPRASRPGPGLPRIGERKKRARPPAWIFRRGGSRSGCCAASSRGAIGEKASGSSLPLLGRDRRQKARVLSHLPHWVRRDSRDLLVERTWRRELRLAEPLRPAGRGPAAAATPLAASFAAPTAPSRPPVSRRQPSPERTIAGSATDDGSRRVTALLPRKRIAGGIYHRRPRPPCRSSRSRAIVLLSQPGNRL